jgi:hypothetical protein
MYRVLPFMDNEENLWKRCNKELQFPRASEGNSTLFRTTTKQTATVFTIEAGVSFDELYKTHAGQRKLIQFLKI